MSKREEIKKKERLQLELQAQFNKLDQTVLSWLNPTAQQTKPLIKENSSFNDSFVIPVGKGLNMETDNQIKVTQFMNATTERDDTSTNVKKLHNPSKSLQALQNKIRTDKRNQNERVAKPQSKYQQQRRGGKNNEEKEEDGNDDDDDDDDSHLHKSKAKKVKSKRPF